MKIEKQVLEAAVDSLMERAQDSFKIAKTQDAIADTQHTNAKKLVTLGEKLETDAVRLAGEIEMSPPRAILHIPPTPLARDREG